MRTRENANKKVLEKLQSLKTERLKDPGDLYWENFLPRLRSRMEEERELRRREWSALVELFSWRRVSYVAVPLVAAMMTIGLYFLWSPESQKPSYLESGVDLSSEKSPLELVATLNDAELARVESRLAIEIDIDEEVLALNGADLFEQILTLTPQELDRLYQKLTNHG